MLIREVKKQPEKSDVEFEATVKNCSATVLGGGEYSQLVNLADHTGIINARFSYGGNRRSLCNGTIITIDGVSVKDYSIPATSEPPAGSPYEYKPDEVMTKTDWEAKDKRMAKMCSLNNATQLIICIAEISGNAKEINHVKDAACKFLDWIYET